jgi:hypothetical protein
MQQLQNSRSLSLVSNKEHNTQILKREFMCDDDKKMKLMGMSRSITGLRIGGPVFNSRRGRDVTLSSLFQHSFGAHPVTHLQGSGEFFTRE